jgi:hypothetical protein
MLTVSSSFDATRMRRSTDQAILEKNLVDDDELYAALDWLLQRQPPIETSLARRHLTNGTLVLYDVSSSYMEGRCCPLARRGYSRDGRSGRDRCGQT